MQTLNVKLSGWDRDKDISVQSYQVRGFLKVLQGCLVVLREILAAF